MRSRPDFVPINDKKEDKDNRFDNPSLIFGPHAFIAFIFGIAVGLDLLRPLPARGSSSRDHAAFGVLFHPSITRAMSANDHSIFVTPAAIAGVTPGFDECGRSCNAWNWIATECAWFSSFFDITSIGGG